MYRNCPAYARTHLTQLLLRARPDLKLAAIGQSAVALNRAFWYKYVVAVDTSKQSTEVSAKALEPCYLRSQQEKYRRHVSDEMPDSDDLFFTVCFASADQRFSLPEEFTINHPNFSRIVTPVAVSAADNRNRVMLVYEPSATVWAQSSRKVPTEFLEQMATIHTSLSVLVSWDEVRAVAPSSRLAMLIARTLVTPRHYAARNLYVWCCAAQNAVCAGILFGQADYDSKIVPHDAVKALYIGPIMASALCNVVESGQTEAATMPMTPYQIWSTVQGSWWGVLLTNSAGHSDLGSFSKDRPYGVVPVAAEQDITPSLRRLVGAVESLYTMADRKDLEPLASSSDAPMAGERAVKRTWAELRTAAPDEEVLRQRSRCESTGWASASTSECSGEKLSEIQEHSLTTRTLHPAAEATNRALTDAYQQLARWRDAAAASDLECHDATRRADVSEAAVARLQKQLAESERQVTEARNSLAQRRMDYDEMKTRAETMATAIWTLTAERDAQRSAARAESDRASRADAGAAAERDRAEAANKRADEAEARALDEHNRQTTWSEEYEVLEARCDALQSQVAELRTQPVGFPSSHPVTQLGQFLAAPNGNGMRLVQLIGQLFPDPAHPAHVVAATLVSALSPPSSPMSPMDELLQLLRGFFESQ
jgi:hypothetical protein